MVETMAARRVLGVVERGMAEKERLERRTWRFRTTMAGWEESHRIRTGCEGRGTAWRVATDLHGGPGSKTDHEFERVLGREPILKNRGEDGLDKVSLDRRSYGLKLDEVLCECGKEISRRRRPIGTKMGSPSDLTNETTASLSSSDPETCLTSHSMLPSR